MFTPSDQPRLFGLPPGVDFAAELVRGILARCEQSDPAGLADVEIYLNTQRMRRRVLTLLSNGRPRVLPRIKLVTDPGADPLLVDIAMPVPGLQRLVELTALVQKLLSTQSDLAPETSLLPLSQSLATLLAEMHGEGVEPEDLAQLDVYDESGHWARALEFVKIAQQYSDSLATGPIAEQRARLATLALIEGWRKDPPRHPVLLAGSTASRGTTALLARAILDLPQGGIILPGYDFEMPEEVWDRLDNGLTGEDHPQYRFALLARNADVSPKSIRPWTSTPPASAARNDLISLALRPAPVTDGWLRDGPAMGDLAAATQGLTLIEAPTPRIEAEAIALRLRQSAAEGIRTALITPDRTLTRQVAAALERWEIIPDDSAGMPLHLSPPGRLLTLAAGFLTTPATAESLLILLKHPLAHSAADRGEHLRHTRDLELHLRRYGPPDPSAATMLAWAQKHPDAQEWAAWVAGLIGATMTGTQTLRDWTDGHAQLVVDLAGGVTGADASRVWEHAAGRIAKEKMTELGVIADETRYRPSDFAALLASALSSGEVHEFSGENPLVLIWGTLEARVQSADMVILAGLNEGVWPEAATPDPWLNRRMRAQAGLLLPERRIGLAAHDFQQAIGGRQVLLSRSVRSDEAETIPSRWLNRLSNLLEGLEGGKPCLAQMRARGRQWVNAALAMDRPVADVAPAGRPSPRPPAADRPRSLAVTDISTLLRDPYAIYARRMLDLRQLDPLAMDADARLKGVAIHEVMERFIQEVDPADPTARDALMQITDDVLRAKCPWPAARILWLAQMSRNAEQIIAQELARRPGSAQQFTEIKGEIKLGPVTLRGQADRIDLDHDGRAILYDYKTGKPPSEKQQLLLDKQLLIEAAIAQRGAFARLGHREVAGAYYLQIGASVAQVPAPLDKQSPDETWAGLEKLFLGWQNPKRGYTAHIAALSERFSGAYDHLARFGEWDHSQDPKPEDVG